MNTDILLGINNPEESPEEVSSSYIIDPNKSQPIVKMDGIDTPTNYQERRSMNAQNPEQQDHDGINSKRIWWHRLIGFLNTSRIIPTFIPDFIQQQIQFYSNEDNSRLYIYDRLARVWRYGIFQTFEYLTSQILLPVNSSGDYDWEVDGTNITLTRTTNGIEVFTPDGELSFANYITADTTNLNFDTSKEVILEMPFYPQDIAATNKTAMGLWGNISATPTEFTQRTVSGLGIRFIQEAGSLYAVTSNTGTYTATLLTGITITPSSQLLLKFIWKPSENKVNFYVDNVLKTTHITDVPSATNVAVYFFAGMKTGSVDFYLRDPKFSIEA